MYNSVVMWVILSIHEKTQVNFGLPLYLEGPKFSASFINYYRSVSVVCMCIKDCLMMIPLSKDRLYNNVENVVKISRYISRKYSRLS